MGGRPDIHRRGGLSRSHRYVPDPLQPWDRTDPVSRPATLVEGPNDAEINAALGALSLAESCTLQNGIAVCVATEIEPAVTNVVTATETIFPISVMVASGTATSAAQPASGASGASNSIPSNTASASGSAVNPSASAANSGGRNLAQSWASASVMVGLVLCMVVL